MEYYIYDIPVFVLQEPENTVTLPALCEEVENVLPRRVFRNIDVIYIGDFKELQGRNAAFSNGAIYMSCLEPTNFDMLENVVHEAAHSLENSYGMQIYTVDLETEFLGKRRRLCSLLSARGYDVNDKLCADAEYSEKFDEFLSTEVGYPTLVSLTMGLFVTPYAATSLQEYFANGFEKYFLDSPRAIEKISPILYQKIEEIINEDKA